MSSSYKSPGWVGKILLAVFVYYLFSGLLLIVAPLQPFLWLAMDPPNYPWLVQISGLLTIVFGTVFLIAAKDPHTFRPIILLGFGAQLIIPIFCSLLIIQGAMPLAAGWVFVLGDLSWAVALGYSWLRLGIPDRSR